jgi:hypothetical protein
MSTRSEVPHWRLVGKAEAFKEPASVNRRRSFPWPTLTPAGIIPSSVLVNLVLDNVGANLPSRDSVDERIVEETRDGFRCDLRGRMPNCVGPDDIITPDN